MTKQSKRYQENKKAIERGKTYSIEEAVDLLLQMKRPKFDESIEIHTRLGIDPKKGDQQVRGTLQLPHGTGKSQRVAVFTNEENKKEAKEAGADIIGGEELIEEIAKSEKCDFDIAVATPDMMPKLGKIARILGPKGLMPSPKTETVTTEIQQTVQALKKGKVDFKADDQGIVHLTLGKMSFSKEQLIENVTTFADVLKKSKPDTSKGEFIQSMSLTSSMSPSIKIQ